MSETATESQNQHAVRNIGLLSASQAINGSNQSVIISVGGLTGAMLAPDPSLATLPVTAMAVGLAIGASPATYIMYQIGRRNGFIVGALIGALGGILASVAVANSIFVLLCVALTGVGMSAAFGQQYRFAAADSVTPELKPRAISFVLFGGVVAGFLGPYLASQFRFAVGEVEFAGSFLIIAALSVITIAFLMLTRLAPIVKPSANDESVRSIPELMKDVEIITPVLTGIMAYGLMIFVMVAAPIAMVHGVGHSVESSAMAIQWHIVFMYAPSFATAYIINKLGAHVTTAIGFALTLSAALIALAGLSVGHFSFSLILLGIGWNFSFIGSTNLLATAYRPNEASLVQGVNEQLVFGMMAVGSISSGLVLQLIGWKAINVLVLPLAFAGIALLIWNRAIAARRTA